VTASWLGAASLPSTLVDLAAGRDPQTIEIDDTLPAITIEHRADGSVWSWVRERAVDSGHLTRLATGTPRCRLTRYGSVRPGGQREILSAAGIDVVRSEMSTLRQVGSPARRI
jgi:hypothetical protein